MRHSSRQVGILSILAVCSLGLDCGNTANTLPFPKTAAWTLRTVNTGADVRPSVVAGADFDGDGRMDVAAGYPGTDTTVASVSIFFQTDIDTFAAVRLVSHADLTGLAALAVADLDEDGQVDIVAACNGRLVYLRGLADVRQPQGWTFTTIDESSGDGINQWNDVAVGNIDGRDGPDIVACNADVGRLSWFQSPASPVSGAGWVRVDIDAQSRSGAASVALDDVDGDGRIDVYSTAPGETRARVAWYQNPADAANDAWIQTVVGNLTDATRLAVGDVNADSLTDVVVSNPTGRQIGWYGRPSNPMGVWAGYQLTVYSGNTPVDVKVAAVDGNGQFDVVVATREIGTLRWFTPIGSQTLPWGENNLADPAADVGRIALADIDADGRLDVIAPLHAATPDQDSIVWFENPE